MSQFYLGKKSLSNLVGVHPTLGFAAIEALKICKVDFSVFDGIRSTSEQIEMVESGASKSMDSYHLYGLAIDLVPWINGKNRWEEVPCKKIGEAMGEIILAHGLNIEWGYILWGWDMPHFQLTGYKSMYDVRNLTFNT